MAALTNTDTGMDYTMKLLLRFAAIAALVGSAIAPAQARGEGDMKIGGLNVITLHRKAVSTTRPELTSVTIAPGRGMQVIQITANFPGKGEMKLLAGPPDLDGAKQMLDVQDDDFGDLGYRLGAAFLVPYPNRIRGTLSADGKTLTTSWQGHTITLPANNSGKLPTAEKHAMHGLILKARAEDVKIAKLSNGEKVSGIIHAGDFGGHWLSKTDLEITIALTPEAVDASVVARNVGTEAEPIAIGWHPYFNLPSGDRTQARIHIPAENYAHVDNYDNVFPTGELSPVGGTQYDLRAADGVPLGKNFYDDNWSRIIWKDAAATVRVIDPAARYGVAIEGLSPEIRTIQMYAPPTQSFVAIEHQYNFADPFNTKVWKGMDTGMVTLKPGASTRWHVRVKVFVP
jgi:aldose 1-epimerase